MRKIGITGGIGSGKSKVLDFLSVVCGAVNLPVRSGGTSGTASGRKMLSEGRGDVWERNFKSGRND